MNKFFCWLTGGHRYEDKNLESAYCPFTRQSLMVNRCVKCGEIYTATINTDAIIKRDLEEYAKRHGLPKTYVRKDGAYNE